MKVNFAVQFKYLEELEGIGKCFKTLKLGSEL